jgi:hypothetical protein
MKYCARKLFLGNSAGLSLMLAATVFAFVGLGCFGGSRSASKLVPSDYIGEWTGSDGSTLSLKSDAGSYKSGNYSVDNASVDVDEAAKTLKLTFFGVAAKEFKIDQSASGNTMKLDGVTYKKAGGGSATNSPMPGMSMSPTSKTTSTGSNSTSHANAAKGETPADDELQKMVKDDLLAFNDAIQAGDFSDFHKRISTLWQKQTSPEKFNQSFHEFIERKIDISKISSEEATFSPEPSVDASKGTKILVVEGRYNTSPLPTKFQIKYVPEGREWKMFGIMVDTTSD